MKCKTCGNEMIQKSRLRLACVGVFMLVGAIILIYVLLAWLLSIILILIAGYLLVWATFGKGGWCRNCKKFPL